MNTKEMHNEDEDLYADDCIGNTFKETFYSSCKN